MQLHPAVYEFELNRWRMAGAITNSGSGRKGSTKTKSGCRTCKIRKVKCGEERPACYRCVSTSRICDGYGIWGGGGTICKAPAAKLPPVAIVKITPSPSPSAVSILPSGLLEKDSFEWFRIRTATKLPGSYVTNFWTTLLLQASLTEPAVFHAVLALSAVHKRGNNEQQTSAIVTSYVDEQFTLQQYSKAIHHLQPHFSGKTRASCRIALITCLVFVSIDLLRGHFTTARTHLENGLEILKDMHALVNARDGILFSQSNLDMSEDWIIETFSRLNLQIELFKHGHVHSSRVLHISGPATAIGKIHTINGAWKEMERMLNSVFHVTYLAHKETNLELGPSQELLDKQRLILKGLSQWLYRYETFIDGVKDFIDREKTKGYELLFPYHTMTTIMTLTCLNIHDEMVFDSYTEQFLLLLRQCVRLLDLSTAFSTDHGHLRPMMDMTRSIVDMGWIPLLYYLATKCRVHRIRIQAIKLLESTPHREGLWDARTAACIAAKVLEMEERDFYSGFDMGNDFPLLEPPLLESLLLPTLPEEYRIHKLEVELLGSPMDRISLICQKICGGEPCRVLLSEYDLHLEQWIDHD